MIRLYPSLCIRILLLITLSFIVSFTCVALTDLIVDGETVVLIGSHTYQHVIIQNGGVLTHSGSSASMPQSLELICETLEIDSTSSIDVSERGYPVESGPGGAIFYRAGGSYGGRGANENGGVENTYGDFAQPNEPGSGGGEPGGYDHGGSGGGMVHIHATTLIVNGTIKANGQDGYGTGGTSGGGGSGGAIYIEVGSISGTGTISTNGGGATLWGGGGGGGRVAIYYTNASGYDFDQVTAYGGIGDAGQANGAPGTVYLQQGTPANMAPTANAGPDQTVTDTDGNGEENITLDGSGSYDPDGTIEDYTWTLGSGSLATILSTDICPTVILPVGIWEITLTVTDNDGDADSDTVVVTVQEAPANQPPVANAGPDQTVTDTDGNGQEDIALDGSESDDPDGDIVSWVWTENGTEVATGEKPTVSLSVGVHTITLTVTDNDGDTDSDDVVITVQGATDTTPPALIQDFSASDGENEQSTLCWTNPTDNDLAEVVVRRNTTGYPENHLDGDLRYQNTTPTPGIQVEHVDQFLVNGTTYYYAVFSRDAAGNWNEDSQEGANASAGKPERETLTLEVPYYAQGETDWCWATCGSMILRYFDTDRDPWQVAAYFDKGSDEGLNDWEVDDLRDYLTSVSGRTWSSGSTWGKDSMKDIIVNALTGGSPVWLSFKVDRKSTRLNSSHTDISRMPSSA